MRPLIYVKVRRNKLCPLAGRFELELLFIWGISLPETAHFNGLQVVHFEFDQVKFFQGIYASREEHNLFYSNVLVVLLGLTYIRYISKSIMTDYWLF